jgi:hypothetical protein
LNNLLCLFLRNGNLRQAFKILAKLRDIDSLSALVIALMTILQARVAIETSLLSATERLRYLEEAISVGEMFLEIE